MEAPELKPLKVDHTKLITQTEYAKMVKLTPQRINQMINEGKLKTVEIMGAVLILLD